MNAVMSSLLSLHFVNCELNDLAAVYDTPDRFFLRFLAWCLPLERFVAAPDEVADDSSSVLDVCPLSGEWWLCRLLCDDEKPSMCVDTSTATIAVVRSAPCRVDSLTEVDIVLARRRGGGG